MKLYTNQTSPFARLVQVAIEELKLPKPHYIEIDPWAFDPKTIQLNPFSMVPLLITEEGDSIYESLIIIEYLAQYAKSDLVIDHYPLYAFGKNLMEQSYHHVSLKRNNPEEATPHPFIDITETMIQQALDSLPHYIETVEFNLQLPSLQLMVALDYLDFRTPHLLGEHKRLIQDQLQPYQARNSFSQTEPRSNR